jgi:F0F1-type ATP synthase assembly protein I
MLVDQDSRDGGDKWRYLAAAMQFTTSPLAGGALGYLADQYFKTNEIWTAIGFFLGFLGGIINLVRLLKPPANDRQ